MQAGKSVDEIKNHLLKWYNLENSRDIRKADYEGLCKWAEERQPGQEG